MKTLDTHICKNFHYIFWHFILKIPKQEFKTRFHEFIFSKSRKQKSKSEIHTIAWCLNTNVLWSQNNADFYHSFCFHLSTMLQKLSKCEVKAWLCWNLMILLPLRFCVKSHFGEFKRSKNVIYGNFRDARFLNFGQFGTWKLLRFTKNQNSEPLKFPKTTFLDSLNSLKFDFT